MYYFKSPHEGLFSSTVFLVLYSQLFHPKWFLNTNWLNFDVSCCSSLCMLILFLFFLILSPEPCFILCLFLCMFIKLSSKSFYQIQLGHLFQQSQYVVSYIRPSHQVLNTSIHKILQQILAFAFLFFSSFPRFQSFSVQIIHLHTSNDSNFSYLYLIHSFCAEQHIEMCLCNFPIVISCANVVLSNLWSISNFNLLVIYHIISVLFLIV